MLLRRESLYIFSIKYKVIKFPLQCRLCDLMGCKPPSQLSSPFLADSCIDLPRVLRENALERVLVLHYVRFLVYPYSLFLLFFSLAPG